MDRSETEMIFKLCPATPQKKKKKKKTFCLNPKSFKRITILSKIQIQYGQGEDKNSCLTLKICSVFRLVVAKGDGEVLGGEGEGRIGSSG